MSLQLGLLDLQDSLSLQKQSTLSSFKFLDNSTVSNLFPISQSFTSPFSTPFSSYYVNRNNRIIMPMRHHNN